MASKIDMGWVAFDVGARKHAFASALDKRHETGMLDNTPQAVRGFLAARLKQCGQLRVVMEATGIYYLDLALMAAAMGAQVMVINPKAAHHFGKAMNVRSKTDGIDAGVLLMYLQRMPFVPWSPPCADLLAVRQFGRHIGQLTDERTAAKNRLHALLSTTTSPKVLVEDLRRSIRGLTKRIDRLSTQALKLVRTDSDLSACFEALDSITGIGAATALPLLGELAVLPRDMNARACTSHAGLDVRLHQSGTSVSKPARLSKQGNKYIRRALYMPAMAAIRSDPHARAFRDRLLARGKKKMQAIGAVMRKLLTVAWALVRNPGVYDGSRLFATMEG